MILGSVLTAKEHVEMFQKRMDEEINRLWQRSIFLATFLVLVFTGYGMLVSKFFDSDFNSEKLLLVHLVSIGISIIGIVLSLLWIMMAKSSKAWQEKYEQSLFKFIEREIEIGGSSVVSLLKEGIADGYLLPLESNKFSNCLLSTKAGAYSPSKINVMIGIVSLIVWVIIISIHMPMFIKIEPMSIIGFLGFLFVFFVLSSWIIAVCRSDTIQRSQNIFFIDNIDKCFKKKIKKNWCVIFRYFKWFYLKYISISLWTIIFIVIIGVASFWISSIIKNNFFDDKNDNVGNLWIEMKTLIIK